MMIPVRFSHRDFFVKHRVDLIRSRYQTTTKHANMKRLLLLALTAGFSIAGISQTGIGIRLGDPTAISLKHYMSESNALEINIGAPTYYKGYDYRYYYTHDNRFKNKYYYNYGYRPNFGIAFQVHYLMHQDFLDVDGLKWYWGPGGQLRYQTGIMHYWDNEGFHEYRLTDIGLGPDITIGFEYTFSDVPVSVALDITAFLEIFDRVRLVEQAGLAVRYNF